MKLFYPFFDLQGLIKIERGLQTRILGGNIFYEPFDIIHNLDHVGLFFPFHGQNQAWLVVNEGERGGLFQGRGNFCNIPKIHRARIGALEDDVSQILRGGRFTHHPDGHFVIPHFQGPAGEVSGATGDGVGYLGNGNTVGGHAVGVQFHPDFIFPVPHDIHTGDPINSFKRIGNLFCNILKLHDRKPAGQPDHADRKDGQIDLDHLGNFGLFRQVIHAVYGIADLLHGLIDLICGKIRIEKNMNFGSAFKGPRLKPPDVRNALQLIFNFLGHQFFHFFRRKSGTDRINNPFPHGNVRVQIFGHFPIAV